MAARLFGSCPRPWLSNLAIGASTTFGAVNRSKESECGRRILAGWYSKNAWRAANADSSMRKGLCAETPSVSHNDRDWLDVYRAAAMEFDRDKLPASIDVAEKAIHQRLTARGRSTEKSRVVIRCCKATTVPSVGQ